MSIELTILLVMLVYLFVQTFIESLMTNLNYGVKQASSGRDDIPLIQPGMRGRLYRAIQNYKENLFYFIPLVLLTAILDASNAQTVLGAKMFLISRLLYTPIYVLGVSYIRGPVFLIGLVGNILMAYGLFQ